MYGLPFREVWALDFEFVSEPGAHPPRYAWLPGS
jgi:hypothetical protein